MDNKKNLPLLSALLGMKCPRCRKGRVFKNPNPYHLKQVGDMHDLCPECKLNFRPEPGFYFGAAIVSYPLMVILNLLATIVFYFIVGDLFNHVPTILITLLIINLLAAPFSFRYSRIIFLYLVVRYDREAGN